jgi:excisionase family DNA binding protein
MRPDPLVQPTLSVEEVAELLGISRTLAYKAARNGELPVIKINTRFIVPTEALLRWMDDTTPASAPPLDESTDADEVGVSRREKNGGRPHNGTTAKDSRERRSRALRTSR